MSTINFQNKEFKIREVNLPKIGNVLISVNLLNNLLIDDNGGYVSDEAIKVDENIFCFIDENDIGLSNIDLINLIVKEIK